MDYLAKNLRDFMAAKGIKEEAAGEAIGVAQSTINRIINPGSSRKIRNPSHQTLQKIALALGSTTHDIVNTDLSRSVAPSQVGGLGEEKLAVALVAVDRAIRAKGLDPSESWGKVARLVLWAIELQDELYPDGINSKADQRGFDAQVQLEFERGIYDGIGTAEQHAARGDEGPQQSAATGKEDRRRRAGRDS